MRTVVLAFLFCCASNQVAAQAGKPPAVDPAKEAAIRKLFEVQGTKSAIDRTIAGMLEKMRPQVSDLLPAGEYKEKLVDAFLERFKKKLDANEMLNVSVPIYDRYLTREDIEGLAAFYSTPLGKKASSVIPQVLSESTAAGMKLGEKWGQEAMTEVLDENPGLRKALETAAATGPKR